MAHTPKSTDFAGDHIFDMTADPGTQVDGLERLAELARNASPEARARLEHTVAVVAQSRRIRSMTLMTVQQAKEKLTSLEQESLSMEVDSIDEEIRSAAEQRILMDFTRKQRPFPTALVLRLILKLFPLCAVVQRMEDDLDATRARLDRLAYLTYRALSTQPEDRARMERTIQLVCRSLQTAAWAHERIGTAKHQREAVEVAALHRWIIEQAQSAGVRITDDDTSR